MYPDINDRTVIITGGASGIGKASAERFSREGANVALVDIDSASGRDVANEISDCEFIEADVADSGDLDKVISRTTDTFGPPTLLHNNAAIRGHTKVHKTEEENWEKVMKTNLDSVFKLSKRVIPYMIERNEGAIVNTSSTAGFEGTAGKSSYSTSKGAVNTLTKQMARDYAPDGIRVNAILPGHVRTNMSLTTDKLDDRNRESMISTEVPIGRDAAPKEVAAVVAFLCSAEASYITGSLLTVDGGMY